jgi:MFS family permease
MHRPIPARLGLPLLSFVAATTLSLAGSFIQKIAIGWSTWEMTHSTFWVAAAALADLLPTLIVSIPAGVLVDRFSPATTFWVSLIASALEAVALFVLAASGNLTLGGLFACAIFLGACNAFTWPARRAYMMQLAPRGSYARVVALFSVGGNAAFFVGPMIAGELLSRFGTASAFAANALAYLPMIFVAMKMPKTESAPLDPAAQDGVLQRIREGFVYAANSAEIRTMLLCFAAAACTARGIMELAPSIAATALSGDVKILSELTSAIAIGALVAGFWMSRGGGWFGRTMIVVTLSGAALALLGYGASGQIVLALAGAAFMGFMLAANNIAVTSAIQVHAPMQYRGRINSLYNMIFKGGPAIGAVVFGWLAQETNVQLASLMAAGMLVAAMIWIISLSSSRSVLDRARGAEPQESD